MPVDALAPSVAPVAGLPSRQRPAPPIDNTAVAKTFKGRADASKRHVKQFHPEWRRNVDLRLGRPNAMISADTALYGSDVDEDIRTTINPDWSLSKTKTANLYSQVPTIQATHEQPKYQPAVAPFAKALNYELGEKRAHVGVAMEEALNDVVNAAGVALVVVGYAARFETVDVPLEETIQLAQGPVPTKGMPDDMLQGLAQVGLVHLQPTERVVSDEFYVKRKSPSDALWPVEFTGSDFDDADWNGYTGQCSWADGKNEFKLRDDQKESVIGGTEASSSDRDLRSSPDRAALADLNVVTFDDLYYWRARVDPEEKFLKAIWRMAFVHGIDEPVIHEPWKGQKKLIDAKQYVGACRFPTRFLTLTYISDNPVPPSDSSAGRPQVNDLIRSRSMYFQNRKYSIPIRGYDVNRIDPVIGERIQRGQIQGILPFNGNGTNSIWEVARASYPSEDFTFDQMTQNDLERVWMTGSNQLGLNAPSGTTAAEANIIQQNASTRVGQERARVASFFLGIAEVLAGLMALYSDFPILSDEERQAMQQAWDRTRILHDLVLSIRPDSTVMLDSQARMQRLSAFLNETVKSGLINPLPIITEMAELAGLDPALVIKQPQPPEPKQPPISFSFKGKDDLASPAVTAILDKYGELPSPENLDHAHKFLAAAQMGPQPPAPIQPAPGMPMLSPSERADHGGMTSGPPEPAPPPVAFPEWNLSSTIGKREEVGA
jgi:hypothetical protein